MPFDSSSRLGLFICLWILLRQLLYILDRLALDGFINFTVVMLSNFFLLLHCGIMLRYDCTRDYYGFGTM